MANDALHPSLAGQTVPPMASRRLALRIRGRRARSLGIALALGILFASALAQQPTTLRLGVAGLLENLDPRANLRTSELQAIAGVYEPLLRLTHEYVLQPGLATRWTLAEDGLSLMLELRPDVRFHDDSAFDAEDVRTTLMNATLGSTLIDVETPDEGTVVLRFGQPSSNTLFALARIPMLPAEAGLGAGALPAGTGPYAFAGVATDTPLRLRRHENYWGGLGAFERVEIHAFTDRAALVDALARGRLDATQARLSATDVQRLATVRGVTVDVVAGSSIE